MTMTEKSAATEHSIGHTSSEPPIEKGLVGRKVIFDPASANELIDLLADEPGHADEDLLDDALAALAEPTERIPGPMQTEIGEGRLIALQIDADELAAARHLIETDEVVARRTVQRLRDRLRARVARARRRRDS